MRTGQSQVAGPISTNEYARQDDYRTGPNHACQGTGIWYAHAENYGWQDDYRTAAAECPAALLLVAQQP